MSAGTNVTRASTPIDLETVQRNIREVMANLSLLDNGQNVRVEELIRQARENLDRNRLFVLQDLEENQGDNNIEDNRNENRVLAVQVERPLNPLAQQLQPVPEDGMPTLQNSADNARGPVDRNQRGVVVAGLPNNGGNNDLEIRDREWADRYERDWVHFRRHRPNNAANENDDVAPNDPRPNRGNNSSQFQTSYQNFVERRANLFRDAFVGPRLGQRPTNEGGGAAPEAGAAPVPLRPNDNPFAAMGGAPVRWQPYRRPARPLRDVVGLEERIAMLQQRLDRLEDGRFYDLMIAGRGEDGIRHVIRTLRQRLLRDNAANGVPNQNANRPNNVPNADVNPERLRLPVPPPRRNVFQLPSRTVNQKNNQQNTAAKRPSAEANLDDRNRPPKRPNIDGNGPGRSADPELPLQKNRNVVADNTNKRRTTCEAAQSSTQNASENIAVEVAETHPKHDNSSRHAKKGRNKKASKISPDDLRDAGPSRVRSESVSGSSASRSNNVGNGANFEENSQDIQNDDVIIVSAYFPVRIKVERDADDDDNARNNRREEVNDVQNHADQPVFVQNVNGIQHALEIPLRQLRHVNPMPPPPAPVLRLPRDNRGAVRALPGRVVNYAREILRHNARVRGPEFPGTVERPYLTVENMVAGLQNLVMTEARNFGMRNRLAVNSADNDWDQAQVKLITIYTRLRKEMREVIANMERLGIQSNAISSFRSCIVLVYKLEGPPGSPYDGGEIGVKIKIYTTPSDIEVCLSNRIWHPNMCPFTGRILHNYVWTNMTLFKILACVRRLLIIPDLETVTTHSVIAKQYRTNIEIFKRTARHWMSVYGPYEHLAIPEYAELLERLVEEDIPKDRALHLLSKNNWDIDKAMEEIS